MRGVALFPNYFIDTMYYTYFIVLTELRMKLMLLVPLGSKVEGQKRGVDLHNILLSPVVLTHFLGERGQFCPLYLNRFIRVCFQFIQVNQFLRNGITLFPNYGEAVPSFLMKESSLMASSSSQETCVHGGSPGEEEPP